jgi:DTW domain-containing protein YfiP
MCGQLSPIPCGIQVVVVRHVLERHRASNTGRLVASCLQGAELLSYAAPEPEHHFDPSTLVEAGSWLLYPRPGARTPQERVERLIVLDATWSQARKMSQRLPGLSRLPALALPAPMRALPRLRQGQCPEHMSTAEAVIAALRHFGEERAATHLEAVLREAVRRFSLPRRKAR